MFTRNAGVSKAPLFKQAVQSFGSLFCTLCAKMNYGTNGLAKSCLSTVGHLFSTDGASTSIADKQFTVCVEGNIASGKTSLLNHFTGSPGVEVFPEPVERWRNINGESLLGLMVADARRWGMTFQTYVQLTMLQTHKQQQAQKIKMMERSIYSAKYCFVENLHRSGQMMDIEYVVLTQWFDWIISSQNIAVDLIVYLQTRPETVYHRIKQRCRKEETEIQIAYLERLHDLHEDWLIKQSKFKLPAPVLVLDADSDFPTMQHVYEQYKSRILCSDR